MNRRNFLVGVLAVFVMALFLGLSRVQAAGEYCDICGMTMPEKSKNHIHARKYDPPKLLNICSLSCLKKAKEKYPKMDGIEFADFMDPAKMIPFESVYLLLESRRIKMDLGGMVMAPYFGAFASEEAATKMQQKYRDGKVFSGKTAPIW